MAIYHFSVKPISRTDGRSAVAAAAYRAGQKLDDARYGKTQDYTLKTGVELSKIYVPKHTAPELRERNTLWNAVEKAENRKDALVAREFEIAFPSELNQTQRKAMLDEFCKRIVKKYGVIVDASIHAPHVESGSDEKNFHAHIMFTTRAIDPSTGYFTSKKYRDFNKELGSETVKQWRVDFADLTNSHLEQAGFSIRVDHRSNKEQGLDYEPTLHEGVKNTQLRRLGIDTEITLQNDAIKAKNNELKESRNAIHNLNQEILATQNLIDSIQKEHRESTAKRLEQEQQRQEQLERDLAKFYSLQKDFQVFSEGAIKIIRKYSSKIEATQKRKAQLHPNKEAQNLKTILSQEFTQHCKDTDMLNKAPELILLHRKLHNQNIELKIPTSKKLFGIEITGNPPSALTAQLDFTEDYFQYLSESDQMDFLRKIRTPKQIENDEKEEQRRAIEIEKADRARFEAERIAEEKTVKDLKAVEEVRLRYDYPPNFAFDGVQSNINFFTQLTITRAFLGQSYLNDLKEKARKIEKFFDDQEKFQRYTSMNTYQQYIKMLQTDNKFFKDQGLDIALDVLKPTLTRLEHDYQIAIEREEYRQSNAATQNPYSTPKNQVENTKNSEKDNDNGLSM